MSSLATAEGATFAHTLRAEWIKFRSLRSTWYTLACLLAVGFGLTVLPLSSAGQLYESTMAAGDPWDPTNVSLKSHIIAQFVLGVLGILVVTSEYATGMVRTSLTAAPRRHRVLAAKVLTIAAVAVLAGQALMFAAFFLGQAMLIAQEVPHAALGGPGVLAAVIGAGIYVAAIAVLAVGLGTIIRDTAGAVISLVVIVFLVPGVSPAFPQWLQGFTDFWPTMGGAAVIATIPNPDYPHPWVNLGVMCLGVAAVLVAAFVALRNRDV